MCSALPFRANRCAAAAEASRSVYGPAYTRLKGDREIPARTTDQTHGFIRPANSTLLVPIVPLTVTGRLRPR